MEAAHTFRLSLRQTTQSKGKGGKDKEVAPVQRPTNGIIWVAKTFPPWQSCVLDTMRELYEKNNGLPDNKVISTVLSTKDVLKKYMKRVMPFAIQIRERVEDPSGKGKDAMAITLDFDERAILDSNLEYLRGTLNVSSLTLSYLQLQTILSSQIFSWSHWKSNTRRNQTPLIEIEKKYDPVILSSNSVPSRLLLWLLTIPFNYLDFSE